MASLNSYNIAQKKKQIVELIDKAGTTEGYPRYYIGLSGLGGSCTRALWFTFRWFKKGIIDGRTNRLFQVGHNAEPELIKALKSIGIKVWHVLDDQAEFVAVYGYAKGHPDGFGINIPGAEKTVHLLEFKTMNDKYFNNLVKESNVEKTHPVYYAQMVLYMYHSHTRRALFAAINKNTSALYTERVYENTKLAKELLKKGETIVFCEDYNELPRIGNNSPTWYECKWCNYTDICFGKEKVSEKNCRTCNDCDLMGEGKFACNYYGNETPLTLEQQQKGCPNHNFLKCIK